MRAAAGALALIFAGGGRARLVASGVLGGALALVRPQIDALATADVPAVPLVLARPGEIAAALGFTRAQISAVSTAEMAA